MKHFLLTRFNLKNNTWKKANNDIHKGLTDKWLTERFKLFTTYCLPSVINQTNQNFIWILVFDIDTPLKFKTEIDSLIKNQANFKVIYADGFTTLLPSIKTEINKHLEETDKHIITTRLDNDDIIHKDFIKTIQHLFQPSENLVIDLRKGYQLMLQEKNEVREFYDNYNPFISFIETNQNYNTVLSKEHTSFNKNEVKVNKSEYLWIQIIHNNNQANRKIDYLKRIRFFNSDDFGIPLEVEQYERFENFIFNLQLIPLQLFYTFKSTIKSFFKY